VDRQGMRPRRVARPPFAPASPMRFPALGATWPGRGLGRILGLPTRQPESDGAVRSRLMRHPHPFQCVADRYRLADKSLEGAEMRRREFIAGLGAAAWPFAARAQQPDRMRRIGVLMGADENDPLRKSFVSAFTQGLADLGWTDRAQAGGNHVQSRHVPRISLYEGWHVRA
jgi:hypothetical protein